jgi:hypothetical protein
MATGDAFKARVAEANHLATQRATQWRIWIYVSKDNIQERVIDAISEEDARRKIVAPNGRTLKRPAIILRIRPRLSSKEWRQVYEEVGLA